MARHDDDDDDDDIFILLINLMIRKLEKTEERNYEGNITEKSNGLTRLEKSLDSNKHRRRKYTSTHSEHHPQKYQTGKRPAMMVYMDTGLKIHFYLWQTGYRNEQMPTRNR